MTRDEIIRAIVDRTIEAARAGTIPPYVTEAATYAAHLAFDAALEEAAKMADSRAAPQNSGLAKGYNYAMRSIAAAIRAKIGGAS